MISALLASADASWFSELNDALKNPLVWFGFGAQALFFMRFLVQWIASEREGRSVIPIAFWYFSIGGACGLLVYAVEKRDPVFILGQSMGLIIYVRNLILIRRERLRNEELANATESDPEPTPEPRMEPVAAESLAAEPLAAERPSAMPAGKEIPASASTPVSLARAKS